MLVSNIVDKMTDDKIGLIVYAGEAYTQLPITSDYVSAKMFLETINPSMITTQGTDIKQAIDLAMKSFTPNQDVSKAIFVITDGEDNEGGAVEMAKAAAEKGIKVYVLGVGSPQGAPIPMPGSSQYITDNTGNVVVSKLNESMCREIAAEPIFMWITVHPHRNNYRAMWISWLRRRWKVRSIRNTMSSSKP